MRLSKSQAVCRGGYEKTFSAIITTILVLCREDDEPGLILQDVGYTDFPFSYELYYDNNVVMLRSEY